MKIYTRTGDDGGTALLGGGRVGKDDARVAAYGEVDELNAVIGWALAMEPRDFHQDLLTGIQRDLFAIGGQLASPDPAKVSKVLAKAQLDDARIAAMEAAIDAADTQLTPLEAFILPGGAPKAAALHMARTVCRRAERAVVALDHSAGVPAIIVRYVNRLSDLLFTLARLANHQAGIRETTW